MPVYLWKGRTVAGEVQTGELTKAREHVVLLTKLCPQGCEELEDLQKALAQAGTPKTN